MERFWARVRRETGCWQWTGALDRYGYGQFGLAGKNLRAHRVAWKITGHELADTDKLDHACNNRGCVNPEHLRVMSQRANVLRSETNPVAINARKTHCAHGHLYTAENTGYSNIPGHAGRFCKACRRRGPDRLRPKIIVAASESCATGKHRLCEMRIECLCPCHAAAHAAAAKTDV